MSEGVAIILFLLSYLLYVKALGWWAECYPIPNNDLEERGKE